MLTKVAVRVCDARWVYIDGSKRMRLALVVINDVVLCVADGNEVEFLSGNPYFGQHEVRGLCGITEVPQEIVNQMGPKAVIPNFI